MDTNTKQLLRNSGHPQTQSTKEWVQKADLITNTVVAKLFALLYMEIPIKFNLLQIKSEKDTVASWEDSAVNKGWTWGDLVPYSPNKCERISSCLASFALSDLLFSMDKAPLMRLDGLKKRR
ncbi:hypothetical protein K438DRAFT_1754158 [Mycena galopus ATCC 62051]|nr:hypothetical protein K438DRAFT_1754158 [Mycena galopus ATCC 62051]